MATEIDTYIKGPSPSKNPDSQYTYLEQQLTAVENAFKKQKAAIVETSENAQALYENEVIVRATADSALVQTLETLDAKVELNNTTTQATIQNIQTAFADSESATATKLSTLEAKVDSGDATNLALIRDEAKTRATKVDSLASKVSALEASVKTNASDARAMVKQETSARSTADTAEATARSNLSAFVGYTDGQSYTKTIQAQITDESTARATADTAEATARSNLSAFVGYTDGQAYTKTIQAQITDEATARANADTAEATARQTLKASYDTQVGNTYTYAVQSRGFSATSSGNAGLFVNNTTSSATVTPTYSGSNRSYNLYVIDRYNPDTVAVQTFSYDIYGSSSNATALANKLNSLDSTKIVVLQTYDEPKANRLTGGLPAAIRRCGGSRVIFGDETAGWTDTWYSRSAYVLVGIPGEGEGTGVEKYAGSVDADPNSTVWYSFTLRNGYINGASGIGAASAAITTEATARASADSALSSSISTLSSTVGSHTSSISTLQTTTASINNTLTAQWYVSATLDGAPAGSIKLLGVKTSDGSISKNLIIDANTSINGDLIVSGAVKGAYIGTGSNGITTNNIVANSVSYTAGQSSTSGTATVNLVGVPGSVVCILGTFDGAGGQLGNGTLDILVNGTVVNSVSIFGLSGSTPRFLGNYYTASYYRGSNDWGIPMWIFDSVGTLLNRTTQFNYVVPSGVTALEITCRAKNSAGTVIGPTNVLAWELMR